METASKPTRFERRDRLIRQVVHDFYRMTSGSPRRASTLACRRSRAVAGIPTKQDEFAGALGASLFAFSAEHLDDILNVCRFGNDDHFCIRHERVIQHADAIGEAPAGR